jgi:hypothetical protein
VSITLEVTDPNKRFEGGTAADKVQVVNTGLITAVLGAPPVSPSKIPRPSPRAS